MLVAWTKVAAGEMRRANILNLLMCQMWVTRERVLQQDSKVWQEQWEEQCSHFLR